MSSVLLWLNLKGYSVSPLQRALSGATQRSRRRNHRLLRLAEELLNYGVWEPFLPEGFVFPCCKAILCRWISKIGFVSASFDNPRVSSQHNIANSRRKVESKFDPSLDQRLDNGIHYRTMSENALLKIH